jgi:protein-S-isoprenylcysteine O-methyltransferase Ste14
VSGAALGTLLFVLLVPGNVIGVVPYLLSGWRMAPPFLGVTATRWVGAALIALGLPLFGDFATRFVREGRGTPAPIAPTAVLVVGGPYRFTRNPGYVAVLALVLGQALLFGSRAVLLYAAALAIGFHLFVIMNEEPTLRRRYGVQYDRYCALVPRWLPRLTPAPIDRGAP